MQFISLFDVYKNWLFTFNIRLPNYHSGYGAGFLISSPEFKTAGWLQG